MGRNFSGSTEGASATILAAGYWDAGAKVTGRFLRSYPVTFANNDKTGEVCQFKCVTPPVLEVPMINGRYDEHGEAQKTDKFAMGALAGWEMALDDLRTQGFRNFISGDYVTIECVGVLASRNPDFSDMPQFRVSVSDTPPKS